MAFREVSVVQVKEALRRWLSGDGERPIARGVGIDRKTARRYIAAAVELGRRPGRRRGAAQRRADRAGGGAGAPAPAGRSRRGVAGAARARRSGSRAWVAEELTVVKIGILLARRGVVVPHRTLARFAVERCGAGRRSTTVRVDDPPPGVELQVDFGRLGLIADGDRRRVCLGVDLHRLFQPASVRVADVHPDDRGRDRRVRGGVAVLRRGVPGRDPGQHGLDRGQGGEHRPPVQ